MAPKISCHKLHSGHYIVEDCEHEGRRQKTWDWFDGFGPEKASPDGSDSFGGARVPANLAEDALLSHKGWSFTFILFRNPRFASVGGPERPPNGSRKCLMPPPAQTRRNLKPDEGAYRNLEHGQRCWLGVREDRKASH